MKLIDLDDLPPRVAQTLSRLENGEVLVLARNGVVVARLTSTVAAPPAAPLAALPPEETLAEVMDQFKAMIEDEF